MPLINQMTPKLLDHAEAGELVALGDYPTPKIGIVARVLNDGRLQVALLGPDLEGAPYLATFEPEVDLPRICGERFRFYAARFSN